MPLSYVLLICNILNQILDILIQYWKPIVGILFTIAGFIIALFKKKPINNILLDIFVFSIEAVNECEAVSKVNKMDPEVKLARAVSYVSQKLVNFYPTIDVNLYIKSIEKIIEALLSTPHKKG